MSVRYLFGGLRLGSVRYSFGVHGLVREGKGFGKRTHTTYFTRYRGLGFLFS